MVQKEEDQSLQRNKKTLPASLQRKIKKARGMK